jgi:DNA-binding NarL/FixJ family response regulator
MQDLVLDKIRTNLTSNANIADTKIDTSLFTQRELDVMALIAKGFSNKEISKQIYISEGTVANYITSILGKTGLEHRTQIAIFYITGKVD